MNKAKEKSESGMGKKRNSKVKAMTKAATKLTCIESLALE